MEAFLPGVSEPLYALEVAYCRGSRWHATGRMIEDRRSFALWSVLVALTFAGSALLPVKLFV